MLYAADNNTSATTEISRFLSQGKGWQGQKRTLRHVML